MVDNVENNNPLSRLVVKKNDGIAQTILKAAKANPSIFEISEGFVNNQEKVRVKEVLQEIQAERRRDGRPEICRRNNIDLVYTGDILEFTPEEQRRIMDAMGLSLKNPDRITPEQAREHFGLNDQQQRPQSQPIEIPVVGNHKPYQQSFVTGTTPNPSNIFTSPESRPESGITQEKIDEIIAPHHNPSAQENNEPAPRASEGLPMETQQHDPTLDEVRDELSRHREALQNQDNIIDDISNRLNGDGALPNAEEQNPSETIPQEGFSNAQINPASSISTTGSEPSQTEPTAFITATKDFSGQVRAFNEKYKDYSKDLSSLVEGFKTWYQTPSSNEQEVQEKQIGKEEFLKLLNTVTGSNLELPN